MFNLIIPYSIKEKLTPSSTKTLVHVLYLQWAYIITLIVILNMPKWMVGDWGTIFLPMLGGWIPAIALYMIIRNWRKKDVRRSVVDDEDMTPESRSTANTETSSTEESASEKSKLTRPTSAYFLWFSEVGREMVMEENPDLKFTEVARKAGKIWKDLDKQEKMMWKQKLGELREKYEKEKRKMIKKE